MKEGEEKAMGMIHVEGTWATMPEAGEGEKATDQGATNWRGMSWTRMRTRARMKARMH